MSGRTLGMVLLSIACCLIASSVDAQTIITAGTDTYVLQTTPDTAYGADVTIEFDKEDTGGDPNTVKQALIRFDIPADVLAKFLATPNRTARLQLDVTNEGDTGNLYRMTTSWDNNTTWNSSGGGVVPGTNAQAVSNATTSSGPGFTGIATTEVSTDVSAWAGGQPNHGWGIISNGTNGQDARSFEATSGSKPQLVLARVVQPYQPPTTTTTVLNRVPAAGPYNNGQTWKYMAGLGVTGGPGYPTDWNKRTFDDSAWSSGTAILGFGQLDASADTNSTNVTEAMLTWIRASGRMTDLFRTTFNVADPGAVSALGISALVEDGGIFYVNGVEVGRIGMPTGTVTVDTPASSGLSGTAESTYRSLNVDLMTAFPGLLVSGTNYLAIELHQAGSQTSSDAGFDLRLDLLSGGQPEILGDLVPEPSTWVMLLGAGFLGLVAWRRRRRGN